MKDKVLFSYVMTIVVALGIFLLLTQPPTTRVTHAASTFAPIQCDFSTAYSSAASAQVIGASNSSMLINICSYAFGSIGGSSFSIVEGTGSTCATNTRALVGGTTAAAGIGLAANGVIDEGGGIGPILKTVVPGDNVCIISSGTGPLSGSVSYTEQPF